MKKILVLVLIVASMVMIGCSTHVHTVGNGAQTGQAVTAAQWYAVFGLVPLNTVDTQAMAAGAVDYEIQTQTNVVDIIVGIPASWITVSRRTVTVTK